MGGGPSFCSVIVMFSSGALLPTPVALGFLTVHGLVELGLYATFFRVQGHVVLRKFLFRDILSKKSSCSGTPSLQEVLVQGHLVHKKFRFRDTLCARSYCSEISNAKEIPVQRHPVHKKFLFRDLLCIRSSCSGKSCAY